jgi:uncharacterized protein (DUF2461 family)
MKFNAAFTVLAGLVALGEAGCYSGGDAWGDVATALSSARRACILDLSGLYRAQNTPEGTRSVCVNANDKKLEFQIFHTQEGDRQLSSDECYDGIQKEIVGCENGGDTTYDNWRYR